MVCLIGVLGLLLLSSDTMVGRWMLALQELENWRENTASSIGHRLFNYETALALMREKPWWGHGTGAFHTEICRFVSPESECGRFNWHPHNQFLFLGVDHGLVGILLYAGLILSLFRAALGAPTKMPRVVLACLASILMVNSMINSPLWSSIESQFFMFMTGLLVSMAWPRTAINPKE
jgi:O-antigen ligase